LKRKVILVITSYFVQYKNEEKLQNFSKETTTATIIDTMRYIYRYRYMFLWDTIALTCFLAKIAQEKSITLDP